MQNKSFSQRSLSLDPTEPSPQNVPLEAFRALLIKESLYYDAKIHDKQLLLRFLKARSNNTKKAKEMFDACQEWRTTQRVDEIVSSFVFEEQGLVNEIWPRFYHKQDRKGRPVLIILHHRFDINQLLACSSEDRLLKAHIREQEKLHQVRLPACSTKVGYRVEQILLILDCQGYPYSQFHRVVGLVHKIIKTSSDRYPESLGKIMFVNAPSCFSLIWAVIKSFFDPATLKKVSILGTNYQEELLNIVDPENLPQALGGTCACPGGCENADAGPWQMNELGGSTTWDFKVRDSTRTLQTVT
ncbi:cytosolic factor, phosphatidylinositol/phosphatidylcholine transfer protein [Kappamyces sp. JEL0829]|nr:cytosolic factor, phosphatidylinositol/phosphatidylcholine transfer protein [Kappamyces sp. JEL0829]